MVASGVGLAIGVVSGIAWGLLSFAVRFFYLNLLLAPVAGLAIGEIVSLSVNRKRSRGLQIIASVAVVISYFVNIAFQGFFPLIPFNPMMLGIDILAIILGIVSAIRPFGFR